MACRIFFLLAASCCVFQVQTQLCVSSTLPAFSSSVTPQVIATTVVDNSVSNALANALQLFIVSDLIQSRLGANCARNLLNGVETLAPGLPALDVVTPCASMEIVSPAPVLETVTPNIYGGVTETLTPMVRGYPDPIYPNTYVTETFVPTSYSCADVIPNLFNPVSEIISPCGCGSNLGLQEVLIPSTLTNFGQNYFTGLPETLISGSCGPNYFTPEVMPPMLPNFGVGIPEIIAPNSFSFPEVISFPQNCYSVPEVISPISYNPCPEIISPNPFGPFTNEIVSPIGPYGPMSAEMLIPPSIPAQLKCNIGYTNSMPCINFNVEPLPFEPSYFNNIPNFYY